jgi:bifunctional non-homologous end joining protein LigD
MPPTLTTVAATAELPSATLYFRQGGSDKVYRVAIEPSGPGFLVMFAFGRRGGTLQNGAKTNGPVILREARRIFDRLVKEKTAKGYTPGEDGTPYAGSEKAGRVTCVSPQLLNPVEEADVERLLSDDAWWAQPKYDGRRTMIMKEGLSVSGINRTGLTVGLPEPVAAAVRAVPVDSCLLDGELVGDVYHCFDCLRRNVAGDDNEGGDLRDEPYALRYEAALNLVDAVPHDALRYAETATTEPRKRELLARLRDQRAEGIVFKQRLAPYTHGRPAVGGPQLKLKFTATASCIIAGKNGSRRSVRLALLNADGARVEVGSVTIPPNHSVPLAGAVVEVRYLYAYVGGSLYQPVYLGPRDDVPADHCRLAQLKYKAAEGDDHDESQGD